MPDFFKIIISLFIVILISIILYVFIFSDFFNVKKFDFINTNLENKYQRELNSVTVDIENFLRTQDQDIINSFIKSFDFSKFVDKSRVKDVNLSKELSIAINLTISEYGLEKIKLYDNNRKLFFSTDKKEMRKRGNFLSFISKDKIERRDDFYDFEGDELSFIFDTQSRHVIFKKNIRYSNKSIGIMLFYYKDIFLTDILRRSNSMVFKNTYFVGNNILILNKPKQVSEDYLFNFKLDEGRLRKIIYRDKSGNEIEKTYRLFYKKLKKYNLFVCRFIDNEIFILGKRNYAILFYIFFFTLYLLILSILFFRKSDFDKAKEKLSLFTAVILEEMIQAKNMEDLGKMHRQLKSRKEKAFQNLLTDFKNLKGKDKEKLELQLDMVFNRIEESFDKKFGSFDGGEFFERIERLLNQFVNTIAEKGIQINSPLNIAAIPGKVIPQREERELKSVELGGIEEVEVLEELREEVEAVSEPEEIEEIGIAEEVEELSEVEGLVETDGVIEPEKVEEQKDTEEIAEAEELEEVKEVEELAEIEAVEEEEKSILLEDFPKLDTFTKKEESPKEVRISQDQEEKKAEELIDKSETLEENIGIEQLFEIKDEELQENKDVSEEYEYLESIDELEEDGDVPKIPEEFYEDNVKKKDDELADEIKQLSLQKTNLQILLEDIHKRMKVDKLSLLINIKQEHCFIQIHQIGTDSTNIEEVVLLEDNVLVQHVYSTKRMVYIANVERLKQIFNNKEFEKEYIDMHSLFIYPIKLFGKIRSLILFFFKKDAKDILEPLVEILEENKQTLRRDILRLM